MDVGVSALFSGAAAAAVGAAAAFAAPLSAAIRAAAQQQQTQVSHLCCISAVRTPTVTCQLTHVSCVMQWQEVRGSNV